MGRGTEGKQYFVGIGAQKAGTSWLSDYLRAHPQVAFSPIKELHYFDHVHARERVGDFDQRMLHQLKKTVAEIDESAQRARRIAMVKYLAMRLEMSADPRCYNAYFEMLCGEGHRVFGEITPAYSLLDEAGFAAILERYADAKFLFVLRNPADRHWSQLRFDETNRGERAFSALDHLLPSLDEARYTLRTDYPRTLQTLARVVSVERVCVLFFERLMATESAAEELQKVTDFLGIDFIEPQLGRKVNVSKSIRLAEDLRNRLVERYRAVYEYVAATMPRELPMSWQADLERLRAGAVNTTAGND